MADMEEREETYLKLFYNRHPGLGAIEPVLCHLPGQPGILIVFWKQSVTAEWGLSPHASSRAPLLCLVTIPGSVCIENWDCVLQKPGRW